MITTPAGNKNRNRINYASFDTFVDAPLEVRHETPIMDGEFRIAKDLLNNSEGWTVDLEKDWVTCEVREVMMGERLAKCVRAKGKFPEVDKDIFFYLLANSSARTTWDPRLRNPRTIAEDFDEKNKVAYGQINMPCPLAKREWMCYNRDKTYKDDAGDYTIQSISRSADHPKLAMLEDYPDESERKNCVWSEIYIGTYDKNLVISQRFMRKNNYLSVLSKFNRL